MENIRELPRRLSVSWVKEHFEVVMIAAFFGIWLGMILFAGMPVPIPDLPSIVFLANHYIYPLIAAVCFQLISFLLSRIHKADITEASKRMMRFTAWYFPLKILAVYIHTSFKTWMPIVNPVLYDTTYQQIDNALPVDEWFSQIGIWLDSFLPCSVLYGNLFVLMFVISFSFHSMFDDLQGFRRVVGGTCLILLVGGMMYWIAPAVGKFLFSDSLLRDTPTYQQYMHCGFQQLAETRIIPVGYFGSAPAAMPSLHTANSLFFLLCVWKKPVLRYVYLVLFSFIVIIAVASHWHYVIDLPVGATLAIVTFWMISKITKSLN